MSEITRTHEDFREAINALTRVTPLSTPNYSSDTLHFYIALEDKEEVYESHINLTDKTVIGPKLNPHLKPEALSEPEFAKRFQEQAQEIKANTYLITNPSKTIPLAVLCAQGFTEFNKPYKKFLAEEKEKERQEALKNPVTTLVQSLKNGIKRLLSK